MTAYRTRRPRYQYIEEEFRVTDHRVMWTHVLGVVCIVAGAVAMFWRP